MTYSLFAVHKDGMRPKMARGFDTIADAIGFGKSVAVSERVVRLEVETEEESTYEARSATGTVVATVDQLKREWDKRLGAVIVFKKGIDMKRATETIIKLVQDGLIETRNNQVRTFGEDDGYPVWYVP